MCGRLFRIDDHGGRPRDRRGVLRRPLAGPSPRTRSCRAAMRRNPCVRLGSGGPSLRFGAVQDRAEAPYFLADARPCVDHQTRYQLRGIPAEHAALRLIHGEALVRGEVPHPGDQIPNPPLEVGVAGECQVIRIPRVSKTELAARGRPAGDRAFGPPGSTSRGWCMRPGASRGPVAAEYRTPSYSIARRGHSVQRSARIVATAPRTRRSKTLRTRGNPMLGKKSTRSRFTTIARLACSRALVRMLRRAMKP